MAAACPLAPCASVPSPLPRMTGLTPDEWGALMAATQAGDAAAYRRLLGEMQRWLVRYYARRLPPAQIDDAVQDTLFAIHRKRHTYDPERPFRPWLTAVARHKWIDQLRLTGRTAANSLPAGIAVPDHESAVTSARLLRQLLDELKPAQAEAIRLVKLEGYSIEEASARTGHSVSLVKVNIHRGLARLRGIIEGRGLVE